MRLLEKIFLILSVLMPVLFVLMAILNFKKVRKSKKSLMRIILAVIISFLLNFTIYKMIEHKDNKEESNIKTTESKPVEEQKEEVEEVVDEKEEEKVEPETTTTTTTKKIETTTTTTTTQPKKEEQIKENSVSTTSKGYKIETINGITYVDGVLIANKTYPLPSTYVPTGTHKSASASTDTCAECIIEEAYQAFQRMKQDIANEGINMWIQSGYRSYNLQNRLYNRYVSESGKAAADTFSARAGHSEHQTGYAFDVCASKGNTTYPCITSGFNGTEPAVWLAANCHKYGFILRYPAGKDNETGYKHESWHFRYVGTDLATKLYNEGDWITLESYFGITSSYAN